MGVVESFGQGVSTACESSWVRVEISNDQRTRDKKEGQYVRKYRLAHQGLTAMHVIVQLVHVYRNVLRSRSVYSSVP